MRDSLLTDYSNYQYSYESKCSKWRTEPVTKRTCNDIACVAIFFVLFGFYIGVGSYYINQNDVEIAIFFINRVGIIVKCLSISIALSFIYILLIKLIPKCMVYTLIAVFMALLLGIAVIAFITDWLLFCITFLFIFVICASLLMCFRMEIQMGIVLIKVSSQFLTQKWGVFVSPFIKIALNVLFSYFWVLSFAGIQLVSHSKSLRGEDTTAETVFAVIWPFIWILFAFIFYFLMVFTIAVACSFWYYKVQGRNYLLTAYRWLFTSSFGSVVYASLLISLVNFLRIFISSRKRKCKKFISIFCVCMLSCCLKNIDDWLQILNHNCIIVMSVTGQGYIDSAKTGLGILLRFLGLMDVSNIIAKLLVRWGVTIVTVVTGYVSYYLLQGQGLDLGEELLIAFIAIIGSMIVSSLILTVLVQAISSVLVLYCFDVKFREMGYSSNNMPAEITLALANYGQTNP